MKETFSNNLKLYRKQKQLSQEQLAEQLGITTQAVSKWECGLSYPDIVLLPQLADLFHVSIDTLLRGTVSLENTDKTIDPVKADDINGNATGSGAANTAGSGMVNAAGSGAANTSYTSDSGAANRNTGDSFSFPQPDFPDDDILRIVQYRGKTLLRKDIYDPNIRIPLSIGCEPDTQTKTKKFFFQNKVSISFTNPDMPTIPIQIWGSADISGDLSGPVSAGHSVSCSGDINGSVEAGGSVTCDGDINGPASAGKHISCSGDIGGSASCDGSSYITCEGDINGDASAGGNISCDGDISGSANAGGTITCDGDINSDASAGGDLSCGGDIGGSATAKGSITCDGNINSDASAGSDLSCDGDITGDVSADGNISCSGDITGDVSAGGNISCSGDIM